MTNPVSESAFLRDSHHDLVGEFHDHDVRLDSINQPSYLLRSGWVWKVQRAIQQVVGSIHDV